MDYSKQTPMGQPAPQAAPGHPAPQQGTYPAPQQGYGPVAAPYGIPQEQAWSTGLCDCFDDGNTCCLTWCCPCITFGRVAEIMDRGATSCGTAGGLYMMAMLTTGHQWIYSSKYRSRMRQEYSLQEAPCNDCCVHCWCEACSLCQMARELKNRGWDLSLGYRLNLEKRGGMIQMPNAVPPPQQAMIR